MKKEKCTGRERGENGIAASVHAKKNLLWGSETVRTKVQGGGKPGKPSKTPGKAAKTLVKGEGLGEFYSSL